MSPRPAESNLVTPQATILDILGRLDALPDKLILVAGPDRRLIGTVTDGDVRRGLMRGLSTSAAVTEVMNPAPIAIGPEEPMTVARARLGARGVILAPVVDAEGRVTGLMRLGDAATAPHDTLAVVMAGGRGRRLAPLTHDRPKPMIEVDGRPMLEIIVERLRAQGFRRVRLAVNYLAEMIVDHFGDGAAHGVEIAYLRESAPRGTAGALSLLTEPLEGPILVMNGDVLTRAPFADLVASHAASGASATVCVREETLQAPFGVVEVDGERLTGLKEKPTFSYLSNAGVYVLSPEALSRVPAQGAFDMPDLLNALAADQGHVRAFRLHEYWMDVGRHPDLEAARATYGGVFG